MDKSRLNIGIIEPSHIVFEGLSNILVQTDFHCIIKRLYDLAELENPMMKVAFDIVILNPAVIQNKLKEFRRVKKNKPSIHWLGLIYSFYDQEVLSLLDDVITVLDTQERILQIVSKVSLVSAATSLAKNSEGLTERETDVLKQLIKGFSNKEIADHLNISVHTVMSHRKNITQKTGIKSQSGLTIYAITQKIVTLNNLPPHE